MKKLPSKSDIERRNLVFAECFTSAEKLGITDRAVSKWEIGRRSLKFSDSPILASIFGVTNDYLFGCEKRQT